jgi:hypothetical protein
LLGGDRAGEIRLFRFLRNPLVTTQEMLEEAGRRTSQRCQGRDVMVIQDTTVLQSQGGGGDYLHAAIALDVDDDAILGPVEACYLSRQSGRKAQRKSLPIEEKESFRWLETTDQAASLCAGARRITVVCDREGDIYEAFALRPPEVELLVRSAQDRSLDDGGGLFASLDALPEAAWADLDLPARKGRAARTARLAIRFATMALSRPGGGFRAGLPATLPVQLVDVREVDPPAEAEPIHWRLLTTRPAHNAAQAWEIVDIYRRRWAIEQLFRTLKTKGFDIEGLKIADSEPRNKLITATFIAAVIIQQLVHARDGGPGPLRPAIDAFDPDDLPLIEAWCTKLEGKTERQKNPHPKGSLAYAAWVCARLGGWNCYYGKPGPIVILEGWLQLQAAQRGVNILLGKGKV